MVKFRLWLRDSWIGAVASVAILVMLSAGPAWAQASKWITTTGVAYVRSVASIPFTNGTKLADTAGSGKLLLTGTTPTIQFGGTTSSQPAINANGAALEIKLADGSAYTSLTASSGTFNGNGIAMGGSGGAFFLAGASTKLFINTAPSSPASCGTSPAVTASNGTAVFVITGGTGGVATGCSITMPAATTGWNCSVVNITAAAAHRANVWTVQTASTTTSVTWEYQTVSTGAATAFTASDVFRGMCFAY